jgi:hypothetical protein
MSVKTQHPEYDLNLQSVLKVRAAVAGDTAIKRAGVAYLPAEWYDPSDDESKKRYQVYLNGSYFMGVTGQTLAAMSGMVFRKPAAFELTPLVEALTENIDGEGMSLDQFAKRGFSDVMQAGRYGVLADYTPAPQGITRAEANQLGLRPYLSGYPYESIINWKTSIINGAEKLTLVVLREVVEKPSNNEFSLDQEYRYRVLRLTDGVYTQQLYDDAQRPVDDPKTPLQPNGRPFDHIPFHLAGSTDNKPSVDKPPLLDIATTNIAHYQTTADHRENLRTHGQLTLGIRTDLTVDEFKEANPNGVKVGARVGYFLGETGGFESVTAPESSSLRIALQDLEGQMVGLGARLVQRGGQAETAEAARINASGEASTLDQVTSNLSECLEAALEDMALFLGENPALIEYKLNSDFWETGLDPQSFNAVLTAYKDRAIAHRDMIHMIKTGKIQFEEGRTYEQIADEISDNLVDG